MEGVLSASGLVAEVRVVPCDPVADERRKLAAFVVPTAAGRALLDEGGRAALNGRLRALLAATVDAVALPRRWRYLDQMPANAQGKVTLADLLALLGNEDAATGLRPRFAKMRELESELHSEPQRVLLELTAPSDLLYFDGHFDVAAILPGVVQVDWAIHYGRHYFALPPRFVGINSLKFQQVIFPNQPVLLELLHDSAKGSLSFRYQSGAGTHASGRVMLRAGGAGD
jgi:3-hydroxymyristoyl/3-hydroxydecanoyl-(acyl carrier protein) dehydratase